MEHIDGQDEDRSVDRRTPHKRGRIWIVIAILLVIGYGVPVVLTANPKACIVCHQMEPYFTSWKASVHETAARNCTYCHVRPGFFNQAVYRVLFWGEIYAAATGVDVPPIGTSLPPADSCTRYACHSLNRTKDTRGDVKIDHRMHAVTQNIECIRCHPGTVHEGVGGIGPVRPAREMCFECHGERKRQCPFCHTKRFTSEAVTPHE